MTVLKKLEDGLRLPRLAIFDMDGLLFDTERIFMNSKAAVHDKYGYSLKLEDYVQTISLFGVNRYAKLYEQYGDDYPADDIFREARALADKYIEANGPGVKPGIEELLLFFNEHGVKCCVASSTPRKSVALTVERGGLLRYFDFFICGDEITRSKPDPEMFLKACEKAGAAPEEAIVFEDSENGLLAAFAGGIPAVCIPDMKQHGKDITDQVAALVTTAVDVPALFDRR